MSHFDNICHDCKIEMEAVDFKINAVFYCPSCFNYVVKESECEHDYTPMLFEIRGGGEQVKLYCSKCKRLSQAKKRSDHEPSDMVLHNLEKYHVFYDGFVKDWQDEMRSFIDGLRDERDHWRSGLPEIDDKTRHDIYVEYMKSVKWRELRDFRIQLDQYSCQICGNTATEVHHLTYRHLGGEYLFELISLCQFCHIHKYHPWKKHLLNNKF